ncbi:hypothetical protein ABZ371_27395 [Streptomyces sp. NPDC005899]|uniref:hypothetical protein n=1 Tax=Streptomyces sp. NPDC005899 TaxID=3155716 RepID=UPI0033DC5677
MLRRRAGRPLDPAPAAAARGQPAALAYWEAGSWHRLRGDGPNEELRRLSGTYLTAKDVRTWHATVMAAVGLAVSAGLHGDREAARKRAVVRTVREVSGYPGNTPAVARASYINPRVIECFQEGRTIAADLERLGEGGALGRPATHGPVEEAVRRLLLS